MKVFAWAIAGAIVALEAFAISQHVDGAALAVTVGLLAGMAGYHIRGRTFP